MYLIALKFSGAKRFVHVGKNGKLVRQPDPHIVVEFGDTKRIVNDDERTVCPTDTLPLHCVANAIAVLCGDRPIPTKRKHSPFADYTEFSRYVEIAKRAKVRVDTIADNASTMQAQKASMYGLTDLSIKKLKTEAKLSLDGKEHDLIRGCPTHETLHYAWPYEDYKTFDAMCKLSIGVDYNNRLNVLQTLSKLRELYVAGDMNVCKGIDQLSHGGKPSTAVMNDCINLVKYGKVTGQTFRPETWANKDVPLKSWGAPVSVHSKPIKTWVMSGVIFLQVTAEEVEMMLKGPEVATILDGGVIIPVDPATESEDIGTFREVVANWDERFESLPLPFAD